MSVAPRPNFPTPFYPNSPNSIQQIRHPGTEIPARSGRNYQVAQRVLHSSQEEPVPYGKDPQDWLEGRLPRGRLIELDHFDIVPEWGHERRDTPLRRVRSV